MEFLHLIQIGASVLRVHGGPPRDGARLDKEKVSKEWCQRQPGDASQRRYALFGDNLPGPGGTRHSPSPMPFTDALPPAESNPATSGPAGSDPDSAAAAVVIPVVAAVIRRGDQFLLARRRPGTRHGGCWEFPGGKLGEGESEQDALARELREELGVALKEMGPCLFTVMDPGSPFRIRFWGSQVNGNPQPLEHSEIRWVSRVEARDLRLAPADARFLGESDGEFLDAKRLG